MKLTTIFLIGALLISIAMNFVMGAAWWIDSVSRNNDMIQACNAAFYLGKMVATEDVFPSHREIEGIPTHLALLSISNSENSVKYRRGSFGKEWIELKVNSKGELYVSISEQSR